LQTGIHGLNNRVSDSVGYRTTTVSGPFGLQAPQEHEVDGCEYGDDSDIHNQPSHEVIPQEQEVSANDDANHE
jgi:hypothetical protein